MVAHGLVGIDQHEGFKLEEGIGIGQRLGGFVNPGGAYKAAAAEKHRKPQDGKPPDHFYDPHNNFDYILRPSPWWNQWAVFIKWIIDILDGSNALKNKDNKKVNPDKKYLFRAILVALL